MAGFHDEMLSEGSCMEGRVMPALLNGQLFVDKFLVQFFERYGGVTSIDSLNHRSVRFVEANEHLVYEVLVIYGLTNSCKLVCTCFNILHKFRN